MNLGKDVKVFAVLIILTFCYSTIAFAGDCDWCVCKGKDTVNSCTKCCAAAQEQSTKLQLRISGDGKAIVDQDGKEVARFAKDMKVQTATETKGKASNVALQGCMRCTYECVVYQGERCVQRVRSCTWDFDCKK